LKNAKNAVNREGKLCRQIIT